MNNQDKEQLLALYQSEYAKLNIQQQTAVDIIYGPVLVLAGPGTGKTQLLALRICNILITTDYLPQNVLCLTYTDAGVNAMRRRLIKFMGPDAYKVQINTFHSFCHKVIRENKDIFSGFLELEMADDIDIHEVLVDLIDALPMNHELKRNTGERHYDVGRLKSLFEIMKKENYSDDYILKMSENYESSLKEDPEYFHKKGEFKGQVSDKKVKDEMDKYHFSVNAAPLIHEYNKRLRERGLIDFNDAINMVIDALRSNEDLKLRYQEQFQHILTDEYQDTNGSQNEILFQLSDYDDQPNLFVVGDDDQAIFKFQGANMYNISTFVNKFNPQIIVLTNNYRSHQSILDRATNLIQYNNERMINQMKDLTKLLIQSKELNEEDNGVFIKAYKNPKAQEIGLINEITRLNEEGIPYHKIAIIYREHREVVDLVKYCTFKNIPINVKKKVNILNENDILRLLNIIEYVVYENKNKDSRNYLLFEILHYDFLQLPSIEISKLAIALSRRSDDESYVSWREVMQNEDALKKCDITQHENFLMVAATLEELIDAVSNVTLQVLIEKILTATGWMNQILASNESTYRLQLINTFFEFVKGLTNRNGKLSASELLEIIDKYKQANIDLPYFDVSGKTDGIQFITAHSAKGLEFENVFIIDAVKEYWNKDNNRNTVKITPNITRSADANNTEDDRRLFFVALTRAEKKCTILMPVFDMKDKATSPLSFLTEMGFDITDPICEEISEKELQDYLSTIQTEITTVPPIINPAIVEKALEQLSLSPTGLNKFLKCPIDFYFENIVKVPQARKPAPGYGRAIHYALEIYFKEIKKQNRQVLPEVAVAINAFHYGMKRHESHFNEDEYKSYSYEGEIVLKEYLERKGNNLLLPDDAVLEKTFETEIDGIPIRGIIDKIEIYPSWIEVVDFKTGKYKSQYFSLPKSDDENVEKKYGGGYWRQLIFYKILLDSDINYKNKLNKSTIHYLNTEESTKEKDVVLSDAAVEEVKDQIKLAYQKIQNHEFEPACNECAWCDFVKNNSHLSHDRESEDI